MSSAPSRHDPSPRGGADVSSTLSDLERKLRELERELADVDATPSTRERDPAFGSATDVAGATDRDRVSTTPEPSWTTPAASGPSDASGVLDEARSRLGALDLQVDELIAFRERLQRSARELEQEYSRVLSRVGASEVHGSPPAPPAVASPPPGPRPAVPGVIGHAAEAQPTGTPAPALGTAPSGAVPHEGWGAVPVDPGAAAAAQGQPPPPAAYAPPASHGASAAPAPPPAFVPPPVQEELPPALEQAVAVPGPGAVPHQAAPGFAPAGANQAQPAMHAPAAPMVPPQHPAGAVPAAQPTAPGAPSPQPAAHPGEQMTYEGPVVVDAGPFNDIAALSAFEQGVAQVPGAADVYVSGFEGHRALVELRLQVPTPLAVEMRRVVPFAFTVTDAAPGRLAVDVQPAALAPGT